MPNVFIAINPSAWPRPNVFNCAALALALALRFDLRTTIADKTHDTLCILEEISS